MIIYRVKYDLVSETVPLTHVEDCVTMPSRVGETELASHLSLMWALVRGETNDLTGLVVTRETESD